jgi:uncharacterized protein YecE (DUF72 family)
VSEPANRQPAAKVHPAAPASLGPGRGAPPAATQATLFELPERAIEAAPPSAEHGGLAAALPDGVRLGTMSWSFPGWRGIVYGKDAPVGSLSELGLGAYGKHPLLGAVEIDRSYYDPLSATVLRAYAEQVPSSFRFLVKAHEACSVRRYPRHARYGTKRGTLNPHYLDPGYARDAVVGPVQSGLGEKLGALLFQFPPLAELEAPEAFADALGAFLGALHRGVTYAVELRTPALLSSRYGDALAAAGAVHCHNAWSGMPTILAQARQLPPASRHPLVVRWLLAPGEAYDDARDRFRPFDRIGSEDLAVRSMIARLVARAAARNVPALVLINNKAEGCAPESAFRLARAIVEAGLPTTGLPTIGLPTTGLPARPRA